MRIDYAQVRSRSKEEFEKSLSKDLENPERFTKSDKEEIKRVERLLDVSDGLMAGRDQYVERVVCECGRTLTMYDFVFTGLIDAGHDKSLILHTMVGSKYVINTPRQIRCSACARVTPTAHSYACGKYSCSG